MSEAAGANMNAIQLTDAERFTAIAKIAHDMGATIYPLRNLLSGPGDEGHGSEFLLAVVSTAVRVLESLGCFADMVALLAKTEAPDMCIPSIEDWVLDSVSAAAVGKVISSA